jgi:co-chaperonin GroES (HSP10)
MIRPMNDRILVEIDKEDLHLIEDSILIKPEKAHDTVYTWATVIAVGPGRWSKPKKGKDQVRVPMGIKVGDRVCFVKFLRNTKTGEALQARLPDNHLIIQEQDVELIEEKD